MEAPANFINNFASLEELYMEVDEELFDISYLRSSEVWNRQSATRPRQGSSIYGPETCDPGYAYICKDYIKDPELILTTLPSIRCLSDARALGYHLPHRTAETICELVFSAKEVEDEWVNLFYCEFFPAYLEREHSWASVHLLKKAFSAHPETFRSTFVNHLMTSIRIPRCVLQDLVVNLKTDKRDYLMRWLPHVDLSAEAFLHNLPTINALFEESVKVRATCHFVSSLLIKYSSYCYTNKDYGRLLLMLLMTNRLSMFNRRTLKELIESHCSEFRGICLAALDHINRRFARREYQRPMTDGFEIRDRSKAINRAV